MNYPMEKGGCSQNEKRMGVLVAPRAPAMEAHERMDDTILSSSLCNKLTTFLSPSREPHIYLPCE